ncbi:hypothetical protein HPB52_010844 [Rhipicephalus sanguineus]|uniref:Uncharacterized protein n=1 Tax=Rhipicephalus sanguineus TaxID=34632 RepID=A0A9D4Q6N6_RHISA|nr:hypothetical protein HPB52_010844 [Rhipicephalus sanguineus]
MACLQQTVPTASVPTAAAAAVPAQGNATRSTTLMRPAEASDCECDSMECQDADTPGPSSEPDPQTPMEERARNPAGKEDGWQTVLKLRQKEALPRGKKLKKNIGENEGKASQRNRQRRHPPPDGNLFSGNYHRCRKRTSKW